jgi:nitrite reductase (NADH) large subunit
VLTTGSSPLRLNVPGADLAGVHTFRDSRDVDLLLTLAAQKKRVVVVGGGLLGLEAAYGLAKAGAPVTLVHLMDRLMERQLDAPAAELLKSLVERKGIEILLNANTARIHGETRVEGVELTGRPPDRRRRGDLRGGHPAEYRAGKGSRHSVNRGIVVDDHLQTGARISLRSANAPSIAASATAWSSRPMSRRGCWRGISPGAKPPMPAASLRPI